MPSAPLAQLRFAPFHLSGQRNENVGIDEGVPAVVEPPQLLPDFTGLLACGFSLNLPLGRLNPPAKTFTTPALPFRFDFQEIEVMAVGFVTKSTFQPAASFRNPQFFSSSFASLEVPEMGDSNLHTSGSSSVSTT